MNKKPMVLVFAGPNGSGKSTITQYFEKVKEAMGGQVLELEVDIAEARGEKRGKKIGKILGEKLGETNKAEKVFCNMIDRGYDIEEAIAISEIPRKRAEELLQKNNK